MLYVNCMIVAFTQGVSIEQDLACRAWKAF